MKAFFDCKILSEEGVISGSVLVSEGKIVDILPECALPEGVEKINLNGGLLAAGFVDIHVHGGGGSDFMDGSVADMENVVATHLRHGTTTIFPTTMSDEFSQIRNTMAVYRRFKEESGVAVTLGGLHLEGPFISPKMCGAQRLEYIISPTDEIIAELKDNADIIARISCAPEVENVYKMANELLPLGVQFSLGHTAATYEQAEEAGQAGFTSVTHLYSATSGFHKVDQKVHIGVTQAGYGIDNLYMELIGDGCHIPKELLRLVARYKGADKICLITDAMRAAGTDVKESYLGRIIPENRVVVDDGVAKLPDLSSFAGSIGTMDKAFRFAIRQAGLSLTEASKMTALTPAKLMKIDDRKGSIAKGKDADFVILDNDLQVSMVFVGGTRVV